VRLRPSCRGRLRRNPESPVWHGWSAGHPCKRRLVRGVLLACGWQGASGL